MEVMMIRKIVFGFIWFFILFIIIYAGCGVLYVYMVKGGPAGNFHQAIQDGIEFRQAYFKIIIIGVLLISAIGTVTGILPGTKKKKGSGNK